VSIKGDERFEIQDEDAARRLRTLAGMIEDELPDGWGFGLMLFTFGEGGVMFWISNAQRADMVKTMKEWIAKNERLAARSDTGDER
jgi:hypothetical protein